MVLKLCYDYHTCSEEASLTLTSSKWSPDRQPLVALGIETIPGRLPTQQPDDVERRIIRHGDVQGRDPVLLVVAIELLLRHMLHQSE